MTTHRDHHFSITVRTLDLPVLYCLRALADFSQKTGNTRIVWGGTKKEDWEANRKRVSFHFSRPSYRDGFVEVASRLLPEGSWEVVATDDDDPARRQGR